MEQTTDPIQVEDLRSLVLRAREFALEAHAGQMYGSGSYGVHLHAVVRVLESFGHRDATVFAAAWLHDVLEDTAVQPDHLARTVGSDVADLVCRVTDEPGRNRKERKAKTYPKIRQDARAVLLKLADRIANVEASVPSGRLLDMYRREHPAFVEALRRPGEYDEMWDHLTDLLTASGGDR